MTLIRNFYRGFTRMIADKLTQSDPCYPCLSVV